MTETMISIMPSDVINLVTTIFVFILLFTIGRAIYTKLKSSDSRFLNPREYLPEDEISTLKQVYYLIMMLLFFILIIYGLFITTPDIRTVAALEIVIILYATVTLDYNSWKDRLLFILLIPYGSLSFLMFGSSIINYIDVVHIVSYIYMIKIYYDKFKNYTETNSLGITIILLFSIVAFSFIFTLIVENSEPLNALAMVSNAFTSNGYAVLGSSTLGKLNSIFLVWGGYILSGVGTATLTATIMTKHFNNKFDKLEKLIKENNKENK